MLDENKLSLNKYLDVSDNENLSDKEKKVRSKIDNKKRNKHSKCRSRSRSTRRHKDKKKKNYKNRSRQRSRSNSQSSSSNEENSFSSSKSRRRRSKKHYSRSSSSSSNEIKYSTSNKPKWTTKEENLNEEKKSNIIKNVAIKNKVDLEKHIPVEKLENILPNDNIKLEEKQKPDFEPSGLLAAQTNTVNGVVLKFTQPLDFAIPNEDWRLYTFKENNNKDILQINKKSFYLVGKDERICHIMINHPSCSRQHAVIQFRKINKKNDTGNIENYVKPYIIDLESTNGTFLNKVKIESARYYELKPYDVINFGHSTRDYVLMKL